MRKLHVNMAWLKWEIALQNEEYERNQRGAPYVCDACGNHTATIYFYGKQLLCPASLRRIDLPYFKMLQKAEQEAKEWAEHQDWLKEHATDWMNVKVKGGLNIYAKLQTYLQRKNAKEQQKRNRPSWLKTGQDEENDT